MEKDVNYLAHYSQIFYSDKIQDAYSKFAQIMMRTSPKGTADSKISSLISARKTDIVLAARCFPLCCGALSGPDSDFNGHKISDARFRNERLNLLDLLPGLFAKAPEDEKLQSVVYESVLKLHIR